jgi:hypothetical protein
MGESIEQCVLPIIQDARLSALEKLRRFFAALDRWKLEHQRLVLASLRIWYGDENAIVRHKLYTARVKRLAPWLEEIIHQGSQEGVFTTAYPDQAARVVIALFEDLGYATAAVLLAEEHTPADLPSLERILAATADALERVLGAPAGSMPRASREDLEPWLVSLTPEDHATRETHGA